jgi:putative OPT family oligopeptide transporter
MNQNTSLPEITVKAFILGVLLSVILSAANAYLGLFAGMTVSASIPAAVVSMGILRLFRKSNILENNIVQTAASAGESLAAGVIFTMPALIILDFWQEFSVFWIAIIAGFGGLLGVLFTIPLRRSLIVQGDLKFPEGVATAEVLETGQHGKGVKHLVHAGIFGGLFKIGSGGLGLWPEITKGAVGVKGGLLYFGSNLSPALLSVGYIVGLNIAVLVFLGGALNYPGLRSHAGVGRLSGWSRAGRTGYECSGLCRFPVGNRDPISWCRGDAGGRTLDDLSHAQLTADRHS